MPIPWDDIPILATLDRLEGEGRAYSLSGEQLMQEVAGAQPCFDDDRDRFARLLHTMAAGANPSISFEQMPAGGNARQPRLGEHEYLQWLRYFQLTPYGRDRARARVVMAGIPDPDEDDGRVIPFLVIEEVGRIIARWYSVEQMPRFFHDAGMPQNPFHTPPADLDKEAYAFDLLGNLAKQSMETRRVFRRFMAELLNGGLDIVLEPDEHADLTAALAKAGWHLKGDTLVIGERQRTPTPTPASAEEQKAASFGAIALSDLHPLIAEAAGDQWVAGHRREAIDRASLAFFGAVEELSGLSDLDADDLMNKAFSEKRPRIVVADLRTKDGRNLQRGTHRIATGAVAAIRNRASHNLENPGIYEAHEQLGILSFLARRLDDARAAPPEWAQAPSAPSTP